jgi:2-polyprenyl-6-methoxyphenol hydroxylase-like FAD-dependent oxidoreductase
MGSDLEVEVLVIGGGPVGMAAALQLHRAGREVLVIDAGGAPDKVCGEGLLPPGWLALEALGVAPLLEEKGAISELVYAKACPQTGRIRRIVAPIERPSFGVKREVLCRAFDRAAQESGLQIWRPARFRSLSVQPSSVRVEVDRDGSRLTLSCRYLIGADGLHSSVRRLAGLGSRKTRTYSRWGTRVYLRDQRRSGVTVTLGDGVESYMTPLGGDLFGLSFIWAPAVLGRPVPGSGPSWQRLIACFPPAFRESLPDYENFFGADQAIGPLQQLVDHPLHPGGRVALVGDAAGYLDALTGEGLCLGMQQASALANLLSQNRLALYPAAHRSIKRRHTVVISLLLSLFARPALKERIFASLLGAPGVFRALVRMAVEHDPWYRILTPDLLVFLRGMLGARQKTSH